MSVNPKDKKLLQQNWEGASENAGSDLPDGTYQFKITGARFHMSDKGKPQFKTKIKVVGGDEEYKDNELEINDNLETKENMGWFKKKLRRLNIAPPEDIDEIIDGTVADQLEGKIFEGQVRTKNDFMNVYVNRLITDSDEGDSSSEDEKEDESEKESVDIEEGATVTWGSGKTGEIVEIIEDENQARIKKEDGTIVRVALDKLELAEDKEEEEEDEEKEDEEKEESFELPDADSVEDMKMPEVKSALGELGFDAADLENPRAVLRGFCALAEDKKAKLNLEELKPLALALDVRVPKGSSMKDATAALAKAVHKRLG